MPIIGNIASGGKKPSTPTIGTATDGGTGTTVSVAFTPSTYIGKSTITYTALSNPGSLTGTGSGSPITVSGLTTGTAYTFTVKGDTNYGVASDYSAASNSVTPIAPSSFESIATFTLGTATNSVTFSSISSAYKSLQIRSMQKDSNANAAGQSIRITFNGDTATNYSYHDLYAFAPGGVGSGGAANATYILSQLVSAGGQSTPFGVSIIDIIDYANTSKNKTLRMFGGTDNNQNTTYTGLSLTSGLWRSTSAINSVTLTAHNINFATGSKFALYGIK